MSTNPESSPSEQPLPSFEGRRVLLVEDYGLYGVLLHAFKLTGGDLLYSKDSPVGLQEDPTALNNYMDEQRLDAVVIHPDKRDHSIDGIEEAHRNGKIIILIEGVGVKKGETEMFERFQSLGIPIVNKLTVGWTNDLLQLLSTKFEEKHIGLV